MKNDAAIIRMAALPAYLGESRTATFNRLNPKSKTFDPTFPKRIRLGVRSAGVLRVDVDEWLASRKAS